jgi:3-methyladenine DNA glycosylase AlkD
VSARRTPADRRDPRRSVASSPPRSRAAIEKLVSEFAESLEPLGRAERAAGEKAYLKSELRFLGIDTPTMRRMTRAWLQARPPLDRATLVALVRHLWAQELHELRAFAIEVLFAEERLLEAEDIATLEWALRRSGTWAYIDALSVRVVGPLVVRHPELARQLDAWSSDDDFWIRRSAMLGLLLPLRQGAGDWKRFSRYADSMLDEKEFFIRKAIGWILREVGKKRPELVIAFLAPRLDRVSGLTLREASKYLPALDRNQLLSGRAAASLAGRAARSR